MEEQRLVEQSEIALSTLGFMGAGLVENEVMEQPVINASEGQTHNMEESEEQAGCQNISNPAVYSRTTRYSDAEDSDSEFLSIHERKKMKSPASQNVEEDNPSPLPLPPVPVTPLKCIKSTSFKHGNNQLIKQYRTRGPKRGLMVIFSYSTFLTRPDDRDVDNDCVLLQDLFTEGFSFKVITHKNLDKTDTLKVMKEMSVEGYECLFIVVSSHGSERIGQWDTEFDCKLGKIPTYEVVHMFNNSNRPELVGVPKVFIFQMCRGSKKLSKTESAARDTATFTYEESEANAERCERMFSDVLIAHSTVPGFESFRNIGDDSKGSLYIEALCHVFARLAHERHVLDLFRILDNRFKEMFSSTITAVESWGFGDLYLHPGLVEHV